MSLMFGEILVKDSLISSEQLQQALDYQRGNASRLGSCLLKMGLVSDDDIMAVLSRQYGVPSINLKLHEVERSVAKLIPYGIAVRFQIVPLARVGSILTVAMTDPMNLSVIDHIRFMTGLHVEPLVTSETSLEVAIQKIYKTTSEVEADTVVEVAGEEAEIDRAVVNKLAEDYLRAMQTDVDLTTVEEMQDPTDQGR
jgi:type IV pilus assembly protein PilB